MFFSDFEDFADELRQDLRKLVKSSMDYCGHFGYSVPDTYPIFEEAIDHFVDNINVERLKLQLLYEFDDPRGETDWVRFENMLDGIISSAPQYLRPQLSDLFSSFRNTTWQTIVQRAYAFEPDDIADWAR